MLFFCRETVQAELDRVARWEGRLSAEAASLQRREEAHKVRRLNRPRGETREGEACVVRPSLVSGEGDKFQKPCRCCFSRGSSDEEGLSLDPFLPSRGNKHKRRPSSEGLAVVCVVLEKTREMKKPASRALFSLPGRTRTSTSGNRSGALVVIFLGTRLFGVGVVAVVLLPCCSWLVVCGAIP